MSAFQERIVSDPSELAVSEQSPIYVSSDGDGDVVIHQYRWDEGDVLIFLCPHNAAALCRAILKAAEFDAEAVEREINVKDATATERQRRHRQKLRDSHGQDNVTVTAKVVNDVDETHQEIGSSSAG